MAKTDKGDTKTQAKVEAGPTKPQGEGQAGKAETKPAEGKVEAKPIEAAKLKTNPMATAKLEVSIQVKAEGVRVQTYNMKEVAPSKNYRKFAIRSDEDLDVVGQVFIWTGTEE